MPVPPLNGAQRQQLVDELHALGLRATPARVGVLAVLRTLDAPVTSAELAEHVRDHGWDAATVYRNLMTLVEAGVVMRADHGDRRWRFEIAGEEAQQHPHFVCTDCGTVSCLPEVRVELHRKLARARLPKRVEVQLRGVCGDCAPV